jgi:hypothetical protein
VVGPIADVERVEDRLVTETPGFAGSPTAAGMALARRTGDRAAQVQALNDLDVFHRLLGRYEEAIACQQESLAIFRELATATARPRCCGILVMPCGRSGATCGRKRPGGRPWKSARHSRPLRQQDSRPTLCYVIRGCRAGGADEFAEGSVLFEAGRTRVLVAASVEERVPDFPSAQSWAQPARWVTAARMEALL